MTPTNELSVSRISNTIEIAGENALLITFGFTPFGDSTDKRLPSIIASANTALQQQLNRFIVDAIPAYTTLLLCIDCKKIDIQTFQARVDSSLSEWRENTSSPIKAANSRLIEIPVFYNEKVGPDLARISSNTGLHTHEIIELHCNKTYTVFTIGFAPGFAYLGNVDVRIAEPRLPTPRQHVAKGSVGIAGQQTGIYPQASPGGWNIIGRTATELIQLNDDGTLNCPYKAGDTLKFISVSEAQFLDAGGSID